MAFGNLYVFLTALIAKLSPDTIKKVYSLVLESAKE